MLDGYEVVDKCVGKVGIYKSYVALRNSFRLCHTKIKQIR